MSDTTILVVEEPEISVVVAEDPTLVVVSAPGPQGPPGPAGSNSSFIHNQSNASSVWTIPHGLPYRPSLLIVESDGSEGDPARDDSVVGLTLLDYDGALVSGIAYGS